MKLLNKLVLPLCAIFMFSALLFSCEPEQGDIGPAGEDGADGSDGQDGVDGVDGVDGEDGEDLTASYTALAFSQTPASILALASGFEDLDVEVMLSSEDQLPSAPNFVYGSMADGAGLLAEENGTYTFINNIEADYAVARILLDENLRPLYGEHILNAVATAQTAQCSGSMITMEEHGFGPLYLSGGEWGGSSKGVFVTDPYKSADDAAIPEMLTAMGQWSTENAVAIGQDAYSGKTVVFIGDDHSDNDIPSGQLGMYVGDAGDLEGGKLYGLKVTTEGVTYEMDMEEGTTYNMEFVELEETDIDLLDAEAKEKGVMGFSRLEDIDWRRGTAANNRELYLAVTGRNRESLLGLGSLTGRIYKVVLNESDPAGAGTITCLLDGDKEGGVAEEFHSPDNILVTENYAYIQEDPNGVVSNYPNKMAADHYARLYQYNLTTGEFKTVLECDQVTAAGYGYGTIDRTWEITGMIDVTDIVGSTEGTFIMITQNHGWERSNGLPFTDPTARPDDFYGSRAEGSVAFIIRGLDR